VKGSGAANLRAPTGALAKGMPKYSETSDRLDAACPMISPLVVETGCPTRHSSDVPPTTCLFTGLRPDILEENVSPSSTVLPSMPFTSSAAAHIDCKSIDIMVAQRKKVNASSIARTCNNEHKAMAVVEFARDSNI
jgi:hypothetical protein